MSAFKDMIEQDNRQVFMNFEEFGEVHNVGGKDLVVIIDNNEQIEREKRYQNVTQEGLYRKQLLFYALRCEIGFLPAPGRSLTFDGKPYIVTDALDEDGILSISLEAVRS
ncbi:MAG: hypothetical protein Q4C60_07550 [Eubacteriales bacterium]|nr:hypothetical protein [Eubacteriales bacterium]